MCDPVSAGLMLAGTALQMNAQRQARNRQEDAIRRAVEEQDAYSRQAEGMALENAQEYRPEARTERFEDARTEAGNSLAAGLVAARDSMPTPSSGGGRISKAFTTAQAKSQADQLQESLDMARAMGRVRGAQDMLTEEGLTDADTAARLRVVGRNATGSARAAQPGIAAAGQPDLFQMAAGQVMYGAGAGGLGTRGFGQTLTPAATGTSGGFVALPGQGAVRWPGA